DEIDKSKHCLCRTTYIVGGSRARSAALPAVAKFPGPWRGATDGPCCDGVKPTRRKRFPFSPDVAPGMLCGLSLADSSTVPPPTPAVGQDGPRLQKPLRRIRKWELSS